MTPFRSLNKNFSSENTFQSVLRFRLCPTILYPSKFLVPIHFAGFFQCPPFCLYKMGGSDPMGLISTGMFDQHSSAHTQDKDTNDDGLQNAPIHVEPKKRTKQPILKPTKWQDMADMSENSQQTMPHHGGTLSRKKKPNAAGQALFWEKQIPIKCGTLQNGICIHVWTWPKHTWMSGVYLHISLENGSWISHHILTIW